VAANELGGTGVTSSQLCVIPTKAVDRPADPPLRVEGPAVLGRRTTGKAGPSTVPLRLLRSRIDFARDDRVGKCHGSARSDKT